jgi:hypothetical protein
MDGLSVFAVGADAAGFFSCGADPDGVVSAKAVTAASPKTTTTPTSARDMDVLLVSRVYC